MVNDVDLCAQKLANLTAKEETIPKKLHGIVFCPMVAAL